MTTEMPTNDADLTEGDLGDRLSGVLVTGAASGIGEAVARRLSATRLVVAADIDQEGLNRLAGQRTAIRTRLVDVADSRQLELAVASVVEVSPIEAVIACAGVSCPGTADEVDPERWRTTMEVNALGVMHTVRAVLPAMKQQGTGTIVVVASASGRVTYVGEPAYVASKHAVVAFCDAVRKEIVGTGIRMCVVEPGVVDTPMFRSHPAIDAVVANVTPLMPDDIAGAVQFILDMPQYCAVNEMVIRPTNQEL